MSPEPRQVALLFPGQSAGKPLSDVYLYWKKLRQRLGLDNVRIHDWHTFASLLVNNGHPLYEVQELLGHSDPRTTTRYATWSKTPCSGGSKYQLFAG